MKLLLTRVGTGDLVRILLCLEFLLLLFLLLELELEFWLTLIDSVRF
jgi:hypothetical protein